MYVNNNYWVNGMVCHSPLHKRRTTSKFYTTTVLQIEMQAGVQTLMQTTMYLDTCITFLLNLQ